MVPEPGQNFYTWEFSTNGGASYSLSENRLQHTSPRLFTQTTLWTSTISTLNKYHVPGSVNAVTIIVQTVPTADKLPQIRPSATIHSSAAYLSHKWHWYPGATIYTWERLYGRAQPFQRPPAVYSPRPDTTTFHRITKQPLTEAMFLSSTNTVMLLPVLSSGIISADQPICYNGDPSGLTSTHQNPRRRISYRWEISSGGVHNYNYQCRRCPYDPPHFSVTTQYRRITVSSEYCSMQSSASGNDNSTSSDCSAVSI